MGPNSTRLDWIRHSTEAGQTQHKWWDCPSSSPKSLSEQWHHCSFVCLWHYQIYGEGWEQRAEERQSERRRWKEGRIDGDSSSLREREREWEREKASSCGLAELTVNLSRFIFSGACCSLKGGQIYMPLPGLLWRWTRRAGISGLKEGGDGSSSQVTGVTQSSRGGKRAAHGLPTLACSIICLPQ